MKSNNLSFNITGYTIMLLFTLVSLLPFLLLIIGSFTSEAEIYKNGYSLFPKELSTNAYRVIFKSPKKIITAYKISVFITAVGTVVSLFLTAMTAYVLNKKDFKMADRFAFFFYFTTLFSGGLIPVYILIARYLHMKNTIWVLIVPGMLNVFNILIMRNFIKSIPYSICESAKIDGAREFVIFAKLYLPLMGPSLACIGLFTALGYWNNWSNAMLYIDISELYPLQYLLYQLNSSVNYLSNVMGDSGTPTPDLPQQSIKLAMTIVSIGPIVMLYPFVQKYFVKGITVGAVKG